MDDVRTQACGSRKKRPLLETRAASAHTTDSLDAECSDEDGSGLGGWGWGRGWGGTPGLPNPGSSVFHVLLLPTMLSRISRRSLGVNLKAVRRAKGIRPGWQ